MPFRKHSLQVIVLVLLYMGTGQSANAQNPFITDQFTADPSARVFNGTVYVYPSHDIPCTEGKGRIGWFCMEDYHVFSSTNLSDWKDHGVIVSQNKVKWADSTNYSMWAPDCIFRNGKYYFYFPARTADTAKFSKGFSIGVAVADKPTGPFVPQAEPIKNVRGIDPNVFIDKDGQAYLYWSQQDIFGAKLKDNMLELATSPQIFQNLPEKGLKEGPYMFERNGKYYLTYPHVENKIERLEYAMGNSPLGPFTVTGVIMDESPTGCWTNHHSIIQFKKQWYLFYHHNDLSPQFDKNRSIRADSLFFNEDGTIRKVVPTLRGIGVTKAAQKIQVDRYSAISTKGASIGFLDSLQKMNGWKVVLTEAGAWVQYNSVGFASGKLKTLKASVCSKAGGVLQVRLGNATGPIVAEIKVPAGSEWETVASPVLQPLKGTKNLCITLKNSALVEVDWMVFE